MTTDLSVSGVVSELLTIFPNGLLIALAIISFVAPLVILWQIGCYLGRPLGNTLSQFYANGKDQQHVPKLQRILGGMVAALLCLISVSLEWLLFEGARLQSLDLQWSWQRLILVLAKGSFEGLIATAILGWTVRLLRMG